MFEENTCPFTKLNEQTSDNEWNKGNDDNLNDSFMRKNDLVTFMLLKYHCL